MRYMKREGFQVKGISADDLQTELEAIRERVGELTPQAVVEAARADSSPIHQCFTWNNAKAAELYRLEEARYLLKSVAYLEDDDGKKLPPVAVWATLSTDKIGVYTPVVENFNTEVRRNQVLEDAKVELRRFKDRYENLKELSSVFAAIAAVI